MSKKFTDIKDAIVKEQIADLNEGVYDPGIFKAFFLAGGPGSGKSYVQKQTTGGMGLKVVNSDDIYEKMLKDAGMDTTPEDIYSDKGQEIRGQAKRVTKARQSNFLMGRLVLLLMVLVKTLTKFKDKRHR